MALVDFIRRNNQPNVISQSGAMMQAAFHAQQVAGVSGNYHKQVTPEGDDTGPAETRSVVYIVDPEAIDAWEKAIKTDTPNRTDSEDNEDDEGDEGDQGNEGDDQ
jgi:hypothetical protein